LNSSRKFCLFYLVVAALLPAAAAAAVTESVSPVDRGPLTIAIDEYNRFGDFQLPELSAAEAADLENGGAVIRLPSDQSGDADADVSSMGVIGFRIIEAPRLLIWLAVLGGTGERDARLTSAMITDGTAGDYIRYQHIDLPWPVHDRHWVIDSTKNTGLAIATEGRSWQHRWVLRDDGRTLVRDAFADGRVEGLGHDVIEGSVYLPANRGSWTMFRIDDGRTLIAAHVEVDLGGRFPKSLVRRFTKSHLKAGFDTLADFSKRVHLSYGDGRTIYTGDGRPISPAEARETAQAWISPERIARGD